MNLQQAELYQRLQEFSGTDFSYKTGNLFPGFFESFLTILRYVRNLEFDICN